MKRVLLAFAALGVALFAWRMSTRQPVAAAAEPMVIDSLPSPAGPGSAEPNLAVGPDGRVHMSWLQAVDSAFALRFATFDGRGWSEPRTIRTGRDFFVNWADFPSVEALGTGRLAAHWLQRTGPSTYAYGVRIALSNDGGRTWGTAIRPHTDSSNTEHGFVSLWHERGQLGAVWLDGRKYDKQGHNPSNEMTLVTTTIMPDGKAGTEITLDGRACDCCQTAAAMTASGPVIVYRDRTADEIRDIYSVRRVNGRWTEPAPVHNDGWKVNYCPVNGPAISASGNRVAIAWFTAASDSAKVKLALSSDAGATWSTPVRVDDGNPAGRVDVVLTPNGGALVSWIERVGGDTAAVRMRRVGADRTPSPATTIASASASRASGFPRMTLAGRDVFFAWTVPGRPSRVRLARAPLASVR